MKNSQIFFLIVLAFIIGIIATNFYLKNSKVCYDLPLNVSKDEWGPKYWESLHSTVDRIPCPSCRAEGIELMEFMHDIVNVKLGKDIHNEENFYKWVNKICDLKKKKTTSANG